tara:strand:+ start:1139 stop:1840 length:702 start_codon:yes stop_codon:yes gene_type:complete
MASTKEYAYYLRGNQIAIIQRDVALSDGLNYTYNPDDGLGISTSNIQWKSPLEAVADGLEIEYSYVPKYYIKQTNITHTTITGYRTNAGYLQIKGGSVNYDTTTDVNDFIVLRNAGTFNGLHKITAYDNVDGTNDGITLDTKYSGSTAWSTFEKTVTLYYRVDVLNDESDTINLQPYLARAIVYYVKSRLAEDRGDMKLKEYFRKQFSSMIERHETSRIHGSRTLYSGVNAIR